MADKKTVFSCPLMIKPHPYSFIIPPLSKSPERICRAGRSLVKTRSRGIARRAENNARRKRSGRRHFRTAHGSCNTAVMFPVIILCAVRKRVFWCRCSPPEHLFSVYLISVFSGHRQQTHSGPQKGFVYRNDFIQAVQNMQRFLFDRSVFHRRQTVPDRIKISI